MLNALGKSVLIIFGLALLFPLSSSTLAQQVSSYPSGYYDFYSVWMSPRVEPMESKTIYVSEYAKKQLPPRDIGTHVDAPKIVTRYPTGYYDFYSVWMSPRVEPMESKSLL